jgi:hypothetical protein
LMVDWQKDYVLAVKVTRSRQAIDRRSDTSWLRPLFPRRNRDIS